MTGDDRDDHDDETGGEIDPVTDAHDPPYDLIDAAPVSIPAGTSHLVTAPARIGRAVVLDALAGGAAEGEGRLVVTTDERATDVVAAIREREPDPGVDRRLLRIIDCQTGHTGLDRDAETLVQDVDTPRNLTDIGIGFANALDAFDELGVDRVRVGLLSLSVVLSYVDQETAYRFCQTLARRIDQESYLGLFAIDTAAHDERTLNTLRRAFDGTIEGRRDDDGYRLRFDDVADAPDGWIRVN
jgi:KaiC/GvpD/RAD55 family RecA-like ATPase